MRLINACALIMNPHMGRLAIALADAPPVSVKVHPAQLFSIAMLFETVAVETYVQELRTLEEIETVRRLAKEYAPSTFLGLPIVQDETMSVSQIDFLDAEGKVVSRICSLAIPTGFQVPQ